jgi:hypothetical protein
MKSLRSRNLVAALISSIILSTILFSCDGETKRLKLENDSLKKQLNASSKLVETMKTVNVLLDSIDATRHSVRLLSADSKQDGGYSNRMSELKDYVKQTEGKIRELEAEASESSVNAETYMTLIDALKDELKIRNEEIGIMEDNNELNTQVNLKSNQLDELEMKLESKRNELKLLDLQIKEMVRTMKISQADSYFAQAGALEEAARRTKLAPNKKRDTYQEALTLYEKALKLGKKEAKAKVDELKTKVD